MKPRVKPLLILAVLVAVLLAGVDIIHRAKDGHGRWHQLAKSLYHAVKGSQARAASLPTERADEAMLIYDDKLGDGWQDWSWGTHDLGHPGPVHAGKAAIFLSPTGNSGNRGIGSGLQLVAAPSVNAAFLVAAKSRRRRNQAVCQQVGN